jgi:hypothetical protein
MLPMLTVVFAVLALWLAVNVAVVLGAVVHRRMRAARPAAPVARRPSVVVRTPDVLGV